jgi:hypothetical protein
MVDEQLLSGPEILSARRMAASITSMHRFFAARAAATEKRE